MNKLIILTVAAFVCGALAVPTPEIEDEASQFAFFEDDQKETGSLGEQRAMFSDFCLQARDEVKAHLKKNINAGASFLFKTASEQILDSAAKVNEQQKAAVEKGQALLKEDARNAAEATGGVFSAIVEGVKSGFYEKFEQLKGVLNKDNIREQVFNGCDDILTTVAPMLEAKLEEAKSELSAATEDEAAKGVIAETTLANVGCLMTGRISKLSRSCDKLKKITPEGLIAIGL